MYEYGEAKQASIKRSGNIEAQLDEAEKEAHVLRDELAALVQQYAPVLVSNAIPGEPGLDKPKQTMSPVAIRVETVTSLIRQGRDLVRILANQSDL